MADTFLFRNNAVSTLLSPISNIATAIFLQTGEGALFPEPVAGQRFAATLTNAAGDIEIVYCSAQPNPDELTVSRGEEGTDPLAWSAGDSITMRLTMGIMVQMLQGDANVLVDSNADMVDGINANATPTPNELLPLDGSSQLPATAYNSLLLEGQDLAYVLARANHTGIIPTAGLPASLARTYLLADGSFTTPDNISYMSINLRSGGGGGGGGGCGPSGSFGGGGGGGGGSSLTTRIITAIPGEVISVVVGAGGAGGIGRANLAGTAGSAGAYTEAKGNIIDAVDMEPGMTYTITTVGTTNWTAIGASSAAIGVFFTYNGGAITGTGGLCQRTWRSDTGSGGYAGTCGSSAATPTTDGEKGDDGTGAIGLDRVDDNYINANGGPQVSSGNGLPGENAIQPGGGGGGGSGADTSSGTTYGGDGGDGYAGYAFFEY